MYWPDVSDLKDFYTTRLGRVVRSCLRGTIRHLWQDTIKADEVVVGLGYATPYLSLFQKYNILPIAYMPQELGVMHWPVNDSLNLSLVGDEYALPFEDGSVDRLVLVHVLEYSEHPLPLLQEVWRVLKPQGKLLVVVPNRLGIWARAEKTPFGYGHPYTPFQLKSLLNDSQFIHSHMATDLFVPPTNSRFLLRFFMLSGHMLGRIIRVCLGLLGGVVVAEAQKNLYAVTPLSETSRAYKRKQA